MSHNYDIKNLYKSIIHIFPKKNKSHNFKDWLAKDMKEPVRMIALDYSTDISKKFQLAKSLDTLEARAARFQTEFARAGIGQRPVVFICHSMGGLLVKQMLMGKQSA
jgi:triacylglycerol esterase/lipase EstA (alpha/beta hydrolase family)